MDLKKAVGSAVDQQQMKLDVLKAKILAERQPKPRPPINRPDESNTCQPDCSTEVVQLRKQVASLIASLKEDYGCSDEEIQALLAT